MTYEYPTLRVSHNRNRSNSWKAIANLALSAAATLRGSRDSGGSPQSPLKTAAEPSRPDSEGGHYRRAPVKRSSNLSRRSVKCRAEGTVPPLVVEQGPSRCLPFLACSSTFSLNRGFTGVSYSPSHNQYPVLPDTAPPPLPAGPPPSATAAASLLSCSRPPPPSCCTTSGGACAASRR